MNDAPRETAGRRYRWPWFVLAAVALAFLLAFLWMRVAVRRLQEYRDPNANPTPIESMTPHGATNQPSSTNAN